MKDLKVSTGVWYLGATSDRCVKEGYQQDLTMEEHFKLAASIEGVGGLERECFQTSDAIKISQLMRRMLGGT